MAEGFHPESDPPGLCQVFDRFEGGVLGFHLPGAVRVQAGAKGQEGKEAGGGCTWRMVIDTEMHGVRFKWMSSSRGLRRWRGGLPQEDFRVTFFVHMEQNLRRIGSKGDL
jgi:hypothetical protein